MLSYIVRFFQRYAFFFTGVAATIACRLILSDDSSWWLELTVLISVAGAGYLLLNKDGVTGIREGGKPGLTMLAIVGFSLSYWYLVAIGLLIITVGDCESAADGLALDRCTEGQNRFLIISVWIAAIVYGLGLWAAIRERRQASD